MPLPLYPQGKNLWYPLDRGLGWPQIRTERGGEEKNFQPLSGLELQIIQLVAQRYTIELSRLLILKYVLRQMACQCVVWIQQAQNK
jgi:hypothetical protein